ncbi:MAG: hypothetical protein R8J41_03415 [Alphaproteobacteria bacterium]|nr:hypothetical protein [Alphaproteobacteria bacterium]
MTLIDNRLGNKNWLIAGAVGDNWSRWQSADGNPLPAERPCNCSLHLSAKSSFGTAKCICKCLRAAFACLGIFLFEQAPHRCVRVTCSTNQPIDLACHLGPATTNLLKHLVDLILWHAARPCLT